MSEPILSGRYKILKKLGEGGFGQTFLAEDLHLPTHPKCVIKRLKPNFSDEESFKLASRLFEQEAEVLYRLGNHPNIPTLLAHFEDDGEFFLAQEYVEGLTLAQVFEAGRKLTEKEAAQFLNELLETLAFVHKQNVIHRDIKPSNLMRRQSDGRIFLIDFGAVKQASVNPFNENPTFKSTVAIGTGGYAPSEQISGKPKFSSDLYSVGLVTIQALTGINPLELKHHNLTGEFVWQHKVKLRQEFADFITKLVRYDFRQRHNSASEANTSLKMIMTRGGLGMPKNSPPLSLPPSPPPGQMQNNQPVHQSPEFIPPTIVQSPTQFRPNNVAPTSERQNFSPPSQITLSPAASQYQSQPALRDDEPPKGFFGRIWQNDLAVSAVVVVAVFGLFITGGYVLVSKMRAGNNANIENSSSKALLETPSADVFQETRNLAAENEENEKRARTKFDWEQIGKNYRRIVTILEAVPETSQNYQTARENITAFQKRAEEAEKKATSMTNNTSLSNSSMNNSTTADNSLANTNSQPAEANRQARMPGARADKMYLSFSSSQGDYIGGGQNKVFTARDGNFSANGNENHIAVRFDGGPDWWTLDLSAPKEYKLVAGRYTGAQRHPFNSPTRSGLSFSGSGRGCNELSGDFNINKIIFDETQNKLLYLDATFVQYCEKNNLPLMGRVHYDVR